jgi:hypothetical protein
VCRLRNDRDGVAAIHFREDIAFTRQRVLLKCLNRGYSKSSVTLSKVPSSSSPTANKSAVPKYQTLQFSSRSRSFGSTWLRNHYIPLHNCRFIYHHPPITLSNPTTYHCYVLPIPWLLEGCLPWKCLLFEESPRVRRTTQSVHILHLTYPYQ